MPAASRSIASFVSSKRAAAFAALWLNRMEAIDFVKLALRDLRSRAIADAVHTQHQPFTLEPT